MKRSRGQWSLSKVTKRCTAGVPAGQSSGLAQRSSNQMSIMEGINFLLLVNTAVLALARFHPFVIDPTPGGWRSLAFEHRQLHTNLRYLTAGSLKSFFAAPLAIRRHNSGWRCALRTLSSCMDLQVHTPLSCILRSCQEIKHLWGAQNNHCAPQWWTRH